MRDLVSYNEKRNEANQEGGADGESHNRSWNSGEEGPTDDPEIIELRKRQVKNFLTTLLISQGVPMISHGDEMGRTQKGNNNTYCQDNELAWMNWDLDEHQEDLLDFSRRLVALRHEHPVLRRRRFFAGGSEHGGESELGEIEWLLPSADRMEDEDWNTWFAKSVMIYLNGAAITEPDHRGEKIIDDDLLVLISADGSDIDFTIPNETYGLVWREVLNTAERATGEQTFAPGDTYTVTGRSIVILSRSAEEREEERVEISERSETKPEPDVSKPSVSVVTAESKRKASETNG